MKNQHIPSAFGRECIALLDGYKKRLSQESPDYTLKSYCDEKGVSYRKVIEWTTRHGYFVRAIKTEVYGASLLEEKVPGETFVQFHPKRESHTGGYPLCGVSITFPDGVNLRLEECSTENVIALLDTYERRRSAREAECSR